MTQCASKINRDILYANSAHALNKRIRFKIENGWQLVGEMKQYLDGRWGCMVTKEIRFK